MKFVTVFTKARTRKRDEKVYLRKRRHRRHESWVGQRWRRGMWTASTSSGDAAVFESVRAAQQIIERARWCKLAASRGWRASVHAVKATRGPTFRRVYITTEVWPAGQAINALAAVLEGDA